MTNPPNPVPTTNKPAQDAVNLIETLAKQGEQAAEDAIIAAQPWMATPVWKQIWQALFDWLVNQIMKPLALLGGRVVISVEEYVALTEAARAQAFLDAAKKAGNPDAVAQASQAVDKAVVGVIRYVGGVRV